MELEEAKRELDGINIQAFLSASYEQNTYIANKADKVTSAIETVLQELDRLQKENEKYISGELMTRNQAKHFEEINKKYYIHKDQIREKIELIKILRQALYNESNVITILQDLLKEE